MTKSPPQLSSLSGEAGIEFIMEREADGNPEIVSINDIWLMFGNKNGQRVHIDLNGLQLLKDAVMNESVKFEAQLAERQKAELLQGPY